MTTDNIDVRLERLSDLCILLSTHFDRAMDRGDTARADLLEARHTAADNEWMRLSRI